MPVSAATLGSSGTGAMTSTRSPGWAPVRSTAIDCTAGGREFALGHAFSPAEGALLLLGENQSPSSPIATGKFAGGAKMVPGKNQSPAAPMAMASALGGASASRGREAHGDVLVGEALDLPLERGAVAGEDVAPALDGVAAPGDLER